jgi:uridine kinase
VEGEQAKAFVIGLAGGSASGKTTVARTVIESLGVPWVCLLSMDSFYKVLTSEQHELAAHNEYNFDVPGEGYRKWEVFFPCTSYSTRSIKPLTMFRRTF